MTSVDDFMRIMMVMASIPLAEEYQLMINAWLPSKYNVNEPSWNIVGEFDLELISYHSFSELAERDKLTSFGSL